METVKPKLLNVTWNRNEKKCSNATCITDPFRHYHSPQCYVFWKTGWELLTVKVSNLASYKELTVSVIAVLK